jgi:PAS domain S-box-containing protein
MRIPKVLDSLRSTSCPAFATDGRGQVLGLNRAAEALLGYKSDAVRGRRCREVFAGRDRFSNLFCLERCAVREMAARDEAVNPFELCLKTGSGEMLDVRLSVVGMREADRKRPAILHLLGPSAQPAGGGPNVNSRNGLTSREHEVLSLLAAGKSCHEMARVMGIGLVTVRNHLKRIFPKIRVHSQAEAVSFAFRNKLI